MQVRINADKELNERYDGDAQKLLTVIEELKKKMDQQECWDLASAVQEMLENGCFCPSCCLDYLGDEIDE